MAPGAITKLDPYTLRRVARELRSADAFWGPTDDGRPSWKMWAARHLEGLNRRRQRELRAVEAPPVVEWCTMENPNNRALRGHFKLDGRCQWCRVDDLNRRSAKEL